MRSTANLLLTCLALGGVVAACEPPNPDTFRRDGGAAPDPTGVIEGTVLYVGPRPQCTRDDGGNATGLVGAVVLTLFEYDNPPPPSGSATSAVSLLTVPGESLFTLDDCMPVDPSEEDRRVIMRSAPFTWPELALGRDPCTTSEDGTQSCPGQSYQIRGFYDYDGDFNPFSGIRNLPTAGDVGGGAFVSTAVSPPVPLEIAFGHITQETNGQVVEGVAVTLGAVVNTERPIFEIHDGNAMGSAETLPLGSDPIAREEALFQMTRLRLTAIVGGDSGRTSLTDTRWGAALTAAGIDTTNFLPNNPLYGFLINPVDANYDGEIDLHPILGTAGINWYSPMIIVKRARNPIEARLGLPDVSIVGTIRPTYQRGLMTDFINPRTTLAFDAVIPPVAVMFTNPNFPAVCRMPIIPPGNYEEAYERLWVDCQDLPTGNYDVNVLSGVAGGVSRTALESCMGPCVQDCVEGGMDTDACTAMCMPGCEYAAPRASTTGYVVDGGNYSSQAWSIPNDLGCPDVLYRATAVNQLDPRGADGSLPRCSDTYEPAEGSVLLAEQSRGAGFAVVDNGPAFDPGDPAAAATATGHGVAACQMAVPLAGGDPSEVTYMNPPMPECCPPQLDQFCGLPLCPLRDAGTTVQGETRFGWSPASLGDDMAYPYPEAVRASADGSRLTREIRVPGEDYRVNADGTITPLCTPFLMPVACCRIAAACAANPEDPACGR